MKKTKDIFLIFSLVLIISAPAISEINAYRYDPSLLVEPNIESVVISPLRHR